MKEPRFKIQGKIYFGNKKFSLEKITKFGDKEDIVKKEFFDEFWEKTKMNDMDSLSLIFQKYIPIIDAEIIERGKNKRWFSLKDESIGGDSKKLFLNKIIGEIERRGIFYNKINEYFKERIERQGENLKTQGYKVVLNESLKTSSRLVVGLGAGHVLETSLTLHHIFGIPYIPASALKGVVRMVSFWEIVENKKIKDEREIEKLQEQTYDKQISDSDDENILKHKLLFGTQNFKGLLVFLDAYPEIQNNQDIFELDVMTPHYSGYYTKDQDPGDWENPNPIVFLTVKKGVNFCFNVLFDEFRAKEILKDEYFPEVAKNILRKWLSESSNLSNLVKNWIEAALKEYGVGAKTRLGYGIFE